VGESRRLGPAYRGSDVGDGESAAVTESGEKSPPLRRGVFDVAAVPRGRVGRAGELGAAAAGGGEERAGRGSGERRLYDRHLLLADDLNGDPGGRRGGGGWGGHRSRF
jgi:hypothetical protein